MNNIELFTKRVDISKNIQVEAREVRYTFFHQIAYQKNVTISLRTSSK